MANPQKGPWEHGVGIQIPISPYRSLTLWARILVTLPPNGSRIRKNSDIAQFHAKWPEFLQIRLQIVANTIWLKCYEF